MSDSPPNDPPPTAPPAPAAESEVIPVEVEAPDAEPATEKPAAPDWEAKIAALEKEKKENWDRYLRSAADLENLRKRNKRELEDARYDAKTKTLKEMLPVVDNLERAIEHAAKDVANNPIVEGVQLVLRQFQTAFERLEVVGVDAQDKPFDPNLHEAISQQESDAPPGTIVQVLQRGYKIGERLLRPSLVVVAKPSAAKPAE
ncbi:MAG: nucleotide exchange factor GrpE [Deltaproteobacteria bacterium]|nr:nucleotide exchange factor GrpE [Deltaproteobacteria bacterium]